MKTVDALIAASDFFVANPGRWTRASLASHHNNRGDTCFCALGGISLVTGCLTPDGARANKVGVGVTSGPVSANVGRGIYTNEYTPIEELSKRELAAFQAAGVHLLAARGAVKYANAASKVVFGEPSIMEANDDTLRGGGYNTVIKILNLAIKNAKRRHINGDRKKASTVQAVAQ